MPTHTHTVNSVTVYGGSGSGTEGSDSFGGLAYTSGSEFDTVSVTATTGTTGTGAQSHTASLANTGSGSAHNNVQPTFILNYIIKT